MPTWNYVTVHAYGRLRVIEETEWIAAQIDALTRLKEEARARPWQVADAPKSFVAAQLKGIVGIEIVISRLEGKWKVSQNKPGEDRAGVVNGLIEQGDENSRIMAALVEAKGVMPDF